MARKRSRAARNIAWVEAFCCVPEGKDAGMPVRLRPWQKRILRQIYDGKTRRVIISFARKNGKTSLIAWILLLHLCGPEAKANSQIISTAQSKKQAAIVFALALKTVLMSPILRGIISYRESDKTLMCAAIGSEFSAMSAEAKTAHGFSPVLCLHDELGQVRGPRSELYETMESAMGAHENPLSIILSTQAPNDSDLLSILIDDAIAENSPENKVFIYSADEDIDPFSVKAIRQANPAYGDFQNADEVKKYRDDAKRMPTLEASYRNLYLNQRIEAAAPYISRAIWKSCGGPVTGDWGDAPVFAGLDLSSTTDLTAFVMMASIGEHWEVKPVFWTPTEGLYERALRDRVEYDVWARNGLIELSPGPIVEYEWVAYTLKEYFDLYNIQQVAFDDWNWKHLKPWLKKKGFEEEWLNTESKQAKFKPFRQGFKSMSPALRDLEEMVLNKKLKHGGHPVLTRQINATTIATDPAGNRKLDKSKTSARIDGAVALAMAASAAALYDDSKPEYQVMVF